jgi:hypothetical protein
MGLGLQQGVFRSSKECIVAKKPVRPKRNIRTCGACKAIVPIKGYPRHLAHDCPEFRLLILGHFPEDMNDEEYAATFLRYDRIVYNLAQSPRSMTDEERHELHTELLAYLTQRFGELKHIRAHIAAKLPPKRRMDITIKSSGGDAFYAAYQGGAPGSGRRH